MTEILVDLLGEDTIDFNSDSINCVGYDRKSKMLYVEFQSNGTVYPYKEVEESTYNLFVGAFSLNRFWREHILGKYTSGTQQPNGIMVKRDVPKEETKQNSLFSIVGGQRGQFSFALPRLSKFGVKWSNGTLTFEPLFDATSEADALGQFNFAIKSVMPDADVKILAVNHYFE